MISNSSFSENKSKSQGSTPMLPVIDNNRRNLKSSSPSQIKRKNSQNQKKSIFFPKIQNEINPNIFRDNEFILDEKTAFFPKENTNKNKNIIGKYEGKIFQKFPKDFFRNFQK